MIEIKCADKERTRAVCGDDACELYEMLDRSEVLGTAVVRYTGDRAELLRCAAPDTALTDALFRAVLNAALANGASEAVSCDRAVVDHAAVKGYSADLATVPIPIREFFSKFVCKG